MGFKGARAQIQSSQYYDAKFQGGESNYEHMLKTSTTLYVGNIGFQTTEEQLYEVFGMAGDVKRIIMGLNRESKRPCGFCFVEYFDRESAENAINYVSGTHLDSRRVRADWDRGFEEGRQYGRGRTGGQVRDEHRDYFDPGRGGPAPNLLAGEGYFTAKNRGMKRRTME